jgi:hypothetical protein
MVNFNEDPVEEYSDCSLSSLASTIESISDAGEEDNVVRSVDVDDDIESYIENSQNDFADQDHESRTLSSSNRSITSWSFLPLLALKNRHPKDDHITFEEVGHKYWINGNNDGLISTTTLIHKFFSEFDKHMIIRMIMRSERYFHDPSYKYYKLKSDVILAMWDDIRDQAAAEGTYNHLQIEKFYNGLLADFSKYEHNVLFKNFERDHMHVYEPFRTEMLMYHSELKITGSCDAIFKNKMTGKFVLVDWKFIKKLDLRAKKTAKKPISHIDDCNFMKYCLQLSIYRYILENEYGFQFEAQFLVLLHKNQKSYKKVETKYLLNEVELLFQARQDELEQGEKSSLCSKC